MQIDPAQWEYEVSQAIVALRVIAGKFDPPDQARFFNALVRQLKPIRDEASAFMMDLSPELPKM